MSLSGPVEEGRRRNMRQLLLRASRVAKRHIAEGLHARGYADLGSTHTTLLSSIDLAGSIVTGAAERAEITKQAMGRLAAELEGAGMAACCTTRGTPVPRSYSLPRLESG